MKDVPHRPEPQAPQVSSAAAAPPPAAPATTAIGTTTISPTLAPLLERCHFDHARFADQQRLLRDQRYSPSLARVDGRLDPVPEAAYARLPPARVPGSLEAAEHAELRERGEEAIRRGEVAAVLLNGGMATRFGGVPKGVTPALDDRSFLSLRLEQIGALAQGLSASIPVVLMSSFATDEATRAHLHQHARFGLPADDLLVALQGISLRLTPDGEIFLDAAGAPSPYATGHGDLPSALLTSPAAGALRDRGIKVLFVSNVDNLGCVADPVLVGAHLASGRAMTAETVARLPGDVGGGPLLVDGRAQLVEGFRLPPGFDSASQRGFNTNTFYFNWDALLPPRPLRFHPVEKQVDDRPAIQFERILGELSWFVDCNFLLVDRGPESGRFLPVKTPDDLVALRSVLQKRYARR